MLLLLIGSDSTKVDGDDVIEIIDSNETIEPSSHTRVFSPERLPIARMPLIDELQTPTRQREKHPCSAHPPLDRHAPARSCWQRSSRRKAPAILSVRDGCLARILRLAIPWSACSSSPFGRRRSADGSSRSLLYRLLPIRFSSGNCQDLPRSRITRAIIRHVPPTAV
jgi:hypothetical protein